MGKSDLSSISTSECRNILDSIHNDLELWQKDSSFLSKLSEDIIDLISQRDSISSSKEFNNQHCIFCSQRFNLLLRRKNLCYNCHFFICNQCCSWDEVPKQWLCKLCVKQRLLDAESQAWIFNQIKAKFRQFGAAKVLQNFCKKKRISDSENDSGYGTANDFMPLMRFLSSQSLNKDHKMADSSHEDICEDEEDIGDEEELAEIHHSIETILEGLLGDTLDDASVDHIYPNSIMYENIFSLYHGQLVEAIQNLSKALQKALHNLPTENGITPTTAHASLKRVIVNLVQDCQELPYLQSPPLEPTTDPKSNSSLDYVDIFSSYNSLVASAVINKVVEENQAKFTKRLQDSILWEDKNKNHIDNGNYAVDNQPLDDNQVIYPNSTSCDNTAFGLPVESVHIEEIEEITQEYTDSEDDKFSSISRWSSSLPSINEVGHEKHVESDIFDQQNDARTVFPEFGCDIVEEPENESCVTSRMVSISTWEENWLFRKKRRVPLYSNLKYQLMTYCDEPPCMLIPCPSESSDTVKLDEFSSELSETYSVGSLEFSSASDIEDLKPDHVNSSPEQLLKTEVVKQQLETEIMKRPLKHEIKTSTPILTAEKEMNLEAVCHENESVKSSDTNQPEVVTKTIGSPMVKQVEYSVAKLEDPLPLPVQDNYETPPRPGTIAEREHKKWLNAVPLPNNPYSAENISKRIGSHKKPILNEPISSFEEFERKLSVSSVTSESTPQNKLDCGLKSIDVELYKRDYYVNNSNDQFEVVCCVPQIHNDHLNCLDEESFSAMSEEALNSFEEKVYISSGKVFTLENHVKRLEREVKDLSLPNETGYSQSFSPHQEERLDENVQNPGDENGSEALPLPSVKCLASRFSTDSPPEKDVSTNKTPVVIKQECEKPRKTRPCMKVHSLTARSLSREFRNLAKQNLPKPMNRTIPLPMHSCEDTSERESLCSPESAPSSCSTAQADNVHGYTSDESSTSTSSIPRQKVRRHISRSILQRATYWERRAEQGLLSDASVSEEFPGVEY